jgi:putative transposase
VKYACITLYHGAFPVRLMCRVLEVAPSGYYAWRKRPTCAHAIADERLLLHVRGAHTASDGTYGAPRVCRELKSQGHHVGQKRVARLMRTDGLVGTPTRRRAPRTTDSTHGFPIAPNLLARCFAVYDANGVAEVNRTWVSDITYVPTREGWLYLAVVLDLASRRVVGWAMRDTLAAELALEALQMALDQRHPAPGLVHHSDRGVQYACTAYREVLAAHGLAASMSRRGDCWDNAVAESFFATLERELIDRWDWRTRAEAATALFDYIATWYNTRRRHSTLDYQSPAAYERQLATAA